MKPLLFVLIFIPLASCKDQGQPVEPEDIHNAPGTIVVITEKTSHQVGEPISFAVMNGTESTPYFVHCNYQFAFYIERQQQGEWTDAGNSGIACQAIYPAGMVALPPGEQWADAVVSAQPGTYRLKFLYGQMAGWNEIEYLISNSFEVQ